MRAGRTARLRAVMAGGTTLALTVVFLSAVSRRDSVYAAVFTVPLIASVPVLFALARPRLFRALAAAYAIVLLPYAFVFSGTFGEGRVQLHEEGGVLWLAALLMACAAIPRGNGS
jgi:hypothetical protein